MCSEHTRAATNSPCSGLRYRAGEGEPPIIPYLPVVTVVVVLPFWSVVVVVVVVFPSLSVVLVVVFVRPPGRSSIVVVVSPPGHSTLNKFWMNHE
jgi:hypothetical protein